MLSLASDNYGYNSLDITLLTDGSNWYAPPTRENIVCDRTFLTKVVLF